MGRAVANAIHAHLAIEETSQNPMISTKIMLRYTRVQNHCC